MELNVTLKVVHEIRLKSTSITDKTDQLEIECNKLKTKIDQLEHEWTQIVDSLGWWTKLFAGALGGNRSKVIMSNELVDKIDELKEELSSAKSEIAKKSNTLNKIIIDELKSQFKAFELIHNEKEEHARINEASRSYGKLVEQAHTGIQDALIFTSWNNLINHPEAKEKLKDFVDETRNYQTQFAAYKSSITSNQERVDLEAMIQFSSESIAMSSFKKIIDTVYKYQEYTAINLIRCQKDIDRYVDHVKKEMNKNS